MVHFIDPVTMKFAGTNDGEGFELTTPKEWVARVAPYLSLGLAVVAAAAAAGRLAGFPIPDVAGRAKEFLEKTGDELSKLRGQAAEMVSDALKLDPDAVAEQLDTLAADVSDRAEAYAEAGASLHTTITRLKPLTRLFISRSQPIEST